MPVKRAILNLGPEFLDLDAGIDEDKTETRGTNSDVEDPIKILIRAMGLIW